MRFRFAWPRISSTVEPKTAEIPPILDAHLPLYANVWRVPRNTVALCGRPAVWTALDLTIPAFSLGPLRTHSTRIRWEQDFGGHLYLVVVRDDPADAFVLESGPYNPGTGALAPFGYPEDVFYNRGMIDFDPVEIHPPSGLKPHEFADLLFTAHRAYDGNQRYTAIEIPFLRVGRDSNSYVIGLLLAAGVDLRAIPKPYKQRRFEWSGYPGVEDPVHSANFGGYVGEPGHLHDGTATASYHGANGDVRYVVLGGRSHDTATLPDGTSVALDAYGRRVLAEREAASHGLPIRCTAPPEHVAHRTRFPDKPEAAGANITLVVDGLSVPLQPGHRYAGTVVERNESIGVATLRADDGRTVGIPMTELGGELRDPKRVDAALRAGEHLELGLHRDRRPRLHLRGGFNFGRSAAQAGPEAIVAAVCLAAAIVGGTVAFRTFRR